MRTVFLLFWIGAVASFFPGCQRQTTNANSDPPKALFFTPAQMIVGDVRQYDKVQCTFTLHNDTPDEIQITRLQSSCGCTLVEAESDRVEANETDPIKVTIAPGHRVGLFKTFIIVSWRILGAAEVFQSKLDLTYRSVRLIVTNPQSCDFGPVSADKPVSIQFEINRGEDKLDWDDLSLASTKLPVFLKKMSRDKYAVSIVFPIDKFPLGLLKDKLTVNFIKNGTVVEKQPVFVQMRLVSNIEIDPPTIYCGVITKTSVNHPCFQIKSSKNSDLRAIAIESSDPKFVQAKCIQTAPGELGFECSTDANNAAPGDHSGFLLITIQADKKRQIVVPFIAYVD